VKEKVALKKSKTPDGKVNFEGNISGKPVPRGAADAQGLMMSKRGSSRISSPGAPDSGKVKALDGAGPRKSGGGGKGPTLGNPG